MHSFWEMQPSIIANSGSLRSGVGVDWNSCRTTSIGLLIKEPA